MGNAHRSAKSQAVFVLHVYWPFIQFGVGRVCSRLKVIPPVIRIQGCVMEKIVNFAMVLIGSGQSAKACDTASGSAILSGISRLQNGKFLHGIGRWRVAGDIEVGAADAIDCAAVNHHCRTRGLAARDFVHILASNYSRNQEQEVNYGPHISSANGEWQVVDELRTNRCSNTRTLRLDSCAFSSHRDRLGHASYKSEKH